MSLPNPTKPSGLEGIDYDCTFIQKLGVKAHALAGAFHLPNTKDLFDLHLSDAATKPHIDAWVTHRIGIPKDKERKYNCIRIKNILSLAGDKACHDAVLGEYPPKLGENGVIETVLPTMTALWYIGRLIEDKPSLFPGSEVTATGASFSPYDVLHGWKLLVFMWKAHKDGEIHKKSTKASATLPIFHRPSADTGGGKSVQKTATPGSAGSGEKPKKPKKTTVPKGQASVKTRKPKIPTKDKTESASVQDATETPQTTVQTAEDSSGATHGSSTMSEDETATTEVTSEPGPIEPTLAGETFTPQDESVIAQDTTVPTQGTPENIETRKRSLEEDEADEISPEAKTARVCSYSMFSMFPPQGDSD
ncbi:hypothetical protein BJX99DRAFT_259284 [Aspergillus californicus]